MLIRGSEKPEEVTRPLCASRDFLSGWAVGADLPGWTHLQISGVVWIWGGGSLISRRCRGTETCSCYSLPPGEILAPSIARFGTPASSPLKTRTRSPPASSPCFTCLRKAFLVPLQFISVTEAIPSLLTSCLSLLTTPSSPKPCWALPLCMSLDQLPSFSGPQLSPLK